MSNKNLLNENTIRRFMKLANVEPLAETFVEKLSEGYGKMSSMEEGEHDPMEEMAYGDKPMEEGEHDPMEEMDRPMMEEEEEVDVEVEAEPDDMDVDVEVDVAPAVEAAVEDVVGQLMAAVKDVLVANEMGDLLDIEMDDEEAAEDAAEDAADDMAAADDDMAAADAMMAADALEENVEIVDEDEMINEVAKRVTARLVKAMADKN